METITSRQNPLAVQIRKLNGSRSARREAGLFPAEGPKLLEEAVKAGAVIDTLVTARGTEAHCPGDPRRVEVPSDLLQSLCDTKTPQGVLFLAELPGLAPPERLAGGRWLGLDGLQDHLAYRRRPGSGRSAPGEPLRGPLLPQDGAGHYGGLLPFAGL